MNIELIIYILTLYFQDEMHDKDKRRCISCEICGPLSRSSNTFLIDVNTKLIPKST